MEAKASTMAGLEGCVGRWSGDPDDAFAELLVELLDALVATFRRTT